MNYIAYEIRDTKMDNLRVHSEISKPKVGFFIWKTYFNKFIIHITERSKGTFYSSIQFNWFCVIVPSLGASLRSRVSLLVIT